MSNFWPSDLNLEDIEPPKKILETAQHQWHQGSNGTMALVLQDATSTNNNAMIVVHAKHVPSDRTSTLFTIVHRPDNPYPVTIQLENDDLPNFLRKAYSPKSPFAVAALDVVGGKTVSNHWVSDTPAEFRNKLSDAFNEGTVKSIIINLASLASDDKDTNNNQQENAI